MEEDDSDQSIIYVGEVIMVHPKNTGDRRNNSHSFSQVKKEQLVFKTSDSTMVKPNYTEDFPDRTEFDASEHGQPPTSVWFPCLSREDSVSSLLTDDLRSSHEMNSGSFRLGMELSLIEELERCRTPAETQSSMSNEDERPATPSSQSSTGLVFPYDQKDSVSSRASTTSTSPELSCALSEGCHIGPCSFACNDKQSERSTDLKTRNEKTDVITGRHSSKKKFVLSEDISNGQELFPVRVWNDVNDQKLAKFEYICGLIDESDYKRTPCVCQCKDGCNARCFCMNEPIHLHRSEIAYDPKTRLLRNPTGWTESIIPNTPRRIWECSAACPCGLSCPNRSAQLGLRYPFEIFMTPNKGWGVRSLRELPAGAFVAEYAGKVRTDHSSSYYTEATWYTFSLPSERVKGDTSSQDYYIDASRKGNLTRFINHACVPNCVAVNVFWDDINPRRGMHIGIYTVRKILPYQELTLDYSADFWKAKAKAGEYCQCGLRECDYAEPKNKRKKKRKGLSKRKK